MSGKSDKPNQKTHTDTDKECITFKDMFYPNITIIRNADNKYNISQAYKGLTNPNKDVAEIIDGTNGPDTYVDPIMYYRTMCSLSDDYMNSMLSSMDKLQRETYEKIRFSVLKVIRML